MEPQPLHSDPRRDAWATIRGFLYQADTTILRWTELQGSDVLELERGEDLDLVSSAVADALRAGHRLEQIKDTHGSVSLRSQSCVAMVANARLHAQQNPGIRMSFRYSSTATVRRERLPGRGPPTPCLELWEGLRRGSLPHEESVEALHWIRRALRSATRPADLAPESWAAFSEVTAFDDAELNTFVQSLEWSLAQPERESLRLDLLHRLAERGALDAERAEVAYCSALERVVTLLATRGVRRLTAGDLDTLLQQLPQDRALQQRVLDLLVATTAHERRIRDLETSMTAVIRQIGPLATYATHDIRVAIERLVLDVPPAVRLSVSREAALLELTVLAHRSSWIHVQAPMGSGKSELLKLRLRGGGQSRVLWLPLRGVSGDAGARLLDVALRQVLGSASVDALADCRALWKSLGEASAVVLDDLGPIPEESGLTSRLAALAESAPAGPARLFSTGHLPIPRRLLERLSVPCVNWELPPFDAADCAALLRLHGCEREATIRALVGPLLAVTQGNGTLLSASARYLSTHGWAVTPQVLESVLRSQFIEQERSEILRRLTERIANPSARQLIYRMNLAARPVPHPVIASLCAIAPVIEHPNETVHALADICLKQTADGRWTVAPLLRALGSGDVGATATTACHLVLAKALLAQTSLTLADALSTISHFGLAGQWAPAGSVLLQSLASLSQQDAVEDDGLLTMLFEGIELPDGIPATLGTMIRGYQVNVRAKRGGNTELLQTDLLRSAERLTADERWADIGACFMAFTGEMRRAPGAGSALLFRATRQIQAGVALGPVADLVAGHFTRLLAVIGGGLQTVPEIEEWLTLLGGLPQEELRALEFDSDVVLAWMNVSSRVWMLQHEKPQPQRDWHAALTTLENMTSRARDLRLTMLEAGAIRGRIVILAEYLKDVSAASVLVEGFLSQPGLAPAAVAVVREMFGRQLFLAGQSSDACNVLRGVEASDPVGVELQYVTAVFYLLRAWNDITTDDLLRLSLRAVHVADSSDSVGALTQAQAHGELAFAYWRSGSLAAAVDEWDRALTLLLGSPDSSDAWKCVAMMLGHTLGYVTSIVRHGEPPETARDGSAYTAPVPGLIGVTRSIGTLFQPERLFYLNAQLSLLANAAERSEIAERRGIEAMEAARLAKSAMAVSVQGSDLALSLIAGRRIRDGVLMSLEAARAAVECRVLRQRGLDPMTWTGAPEPPLGPADEALAEEWALTSCLVPLASTILLSTTEDGDTMRVIVAQVAAVCEEVALVVHGAAATAWQTCASAAKLILASDSRMRDVLQLGQADSLREIQAVRAFCYLLATVAADADLPNSAYAMGAVAPWVGQVMREDRWAYNRIFVAAVRQFWLRAFATRRFAFTAPTLVAGDLEAAQALEGSVALKAVLRAIGSGLRITWPQGVATYLSA